MKKTKIFNKHMLISNSYAKILKNEFDKRMEKNHRYSLRAFAKFLSISPSSLSSILSGKKGLSDKLARNICQILEFNYEETLFFCALVNSKHARKREVREANKKRVTDILRKKQRIIINDKEFVSELKNFVMMELLKILKVKAPLSQSLLNSKSLSCSIPEQQAIINKMIGLSLVEIVDGHYVVKHETFLVPDGISEVAQKQAHFKALELAKLAFDNDTYDEREFYFIITPVNKKRMKEIKTKIREFADELMYQYGEPRQADSVYGLCTYFFSLEKDC
jgi:uncharacterized protein (TIGR02147 family)